MSDPRHPARVLDATLAAGSFMLFACGDVVDQVGEPTTAAQPASTHPIFVVFGAVVGLRKLNSSRAPIATVVTRKSMPMTTSVFGVPSSTSYTSERGDARQDY
jgi:hypothetical protein